VKLLKLPLEDRPLLTKYREIRLDLAGVGKDDALEMKHEGKGIIRLTTRGQLGVESKIKAATGFQAYEYEHAELVTLFKDVLKSSEKYFEFTQKRLRSAKDILKKGGHVIPSFKDPKFRMYHDNRRQIIEPENFKGHDLSNDLLDSKPFLNKDQASRFRFISKFPYSIAYNKLNSVRVA
jgi:hypothetical protein